MNKGKHNLVYDKNKENKENKEINANPLSNVCK